MQTPCTMVKPTPTFSAKGSLGETIKAQRKAAHEKKRKVASASIDRMVKVEDLCEVIVDAYDLGEYVFDRLEFHYEDWSHEEKKAKENKKLNGTNLLEGQKSRKENDESLDVQFEHLHLGVRHQAGDKVSEYINYDSSYMLEIMPKVGKAIRDAHFWVEAYKPIYLVLDSAGGYGTKEVIAQYKAMMKNDYNIIPVHQILQSPETNLLNLGIWMSLQSAVEKCHRLRRVTRMLFMLLCYERLKGCCQAKRHS